MTSWMAERDRLLAQTKAFVKEVAAARPKLAPSFRGELLSPNTLRGDAALESNGGGIANDPVEGTKQIAALPDLQQSAVRPTSASSVVSSEVSVPEMRPAASSQTAANSGEADNELSVRSSRTFSNLSDAVLTIPRIATSERDDIAIRVSHFREHQRRLAREREQFSEQVRTRIKSLIAEKR